MSPMSTNFRRSRPRARYFGLTLTIPDGVTFEDRLTNAPVVRERTERKVAVPVSGRLTPTPA